MDKLAIKAENLGKLYRLGEVGTGTISHDINRWWARMRGKDDPFAKIGEVNDRTTKGSSNYVWAAKNINFELPKGEVLGIIGRNGAGKSTLLKLLSKVTQPSEGRIKVNGRIASLLEVGTGFHPEMTGRENIFQNGAILGMTKQEIRSKFDEIVDFSGVERYIDTPVKRYSSGMYVRLAFAVAAHLEPEILIIDEVLAVGDADFQKKCLGKMKDVSRNEGRTVLFVSHNMAAVQQLCTKGLLMENGTVKFEGTVDDTIAAYLASEKTEDFFLENFEQYKVSESPFFKPLKFGLLDADRNQIHGFVDNSKNINVYIEFAVEEVSPDLTYGFAVFNNTDDLIFWSFNKDAREADWPQTKAGINKIIASIPARLLNEGDYRICLMASIHYRFWIIEPTQNPPALLLSIKGGLSDSKFWIEKRPGFIGPVIAYESVI